MSKLGNILFIVCALVLAVPASARGQTITYEGCTDYRGLPVASVPNPDIQDVAVATTTAANRPIIYFNPTLMQKLNPKTRLFFYAHECGHHALGHLSLIPWAGDLAITMEQAADCYGIAALFGAGLIGEHGLSVIERDLTQLGKGDWDHLPGPVRAINLRRCLSASPYRSYTFRVSTPGEQVVR